MFAPSRPRSCHAPHQRENPTGLVAHHPLIPNLDPQRVERHQRIKDFEGAVLPFGDLFQYGVVWPCCPLICTRAALTGLLLLALRATGAMGTVLSVHFGLALGLFLTLPYGKMVHGLYRFGALLRHAAEQP